MTVLLVENLKLIMLFLLIGSIIGLSHLSGGKAKPARRDGVAATAGRHRLASRGVEKCRSSSTGKTCVDRQRLVDDRRLPSQGDVRRQAVHARDGDRQRSADAKGADRSRALSQPLQALVQERRRSADRALRRVPAGELHVDQLSPSCCFADRYFALIRIGDTGDGVAARKAVEPRNGKPSPSVRSRACALCHRVHGNDRAPARPRAGVPYNSFRALKISTEDQRRSVMKHVEPPSPEPSSRIPLFLIGKDSRGNWVVQDNQGSCGGLFVNRAEALKFAMFENGNRPQAVIMVPGVFELDMSGKAGPDLAPPSQHRTNAAGGLRRRRWPPSAATSRSSRAMRPRCRRRLATRATSTAPRSNISAIARSGPAPPLWSSAAPPAKRRR